VNKHGKIIVHVLTIDPRDRQWSRKYSQPRKIRKITGGKGHAS